jgi:hypothetical protein
MNDLISQIERGYIEVEVYNSPQRPGKVFNREARDELIHLAKLGQQRDWIPVTDGMPPHESIVDIWYDENELGGSRIADVTYNAQENVFVCWNGEICGIEGQDEEGKVTHWRGTGGDKPLPALPEQAELKHE